ncbi:type II secretion system protein GspG [Oligosphaera ethanolica]|uniref:Prepilin-type N-terminal cleavage/methylation domain-containing protein n=1 Tax=Oligosphaera ethanolica TaxID=760260 RepID=A0AAE4AP90_9BACT|nr:type II secretion system protein GspG [Oligosphaera ethanolica]MDQ0291069.1 prepilin-type N-terminal cleavage/methylation domain-containing protein [Oligosphaera ethanolica]
MKQRRHAFTLIELLVVIGIIMVLAGITMAGLGFAGRRADETKTQAIMEEFAMALETFRQDYGYYPIQTSTDDEGKDIKVDFHGDTWDLFMNRYAPPPAPINVPNKKNRPYMEGITGNAGDELLDAYGNALYYLSPGEKNPQKYDLWSKGPDGKHGDKKDNTDDKLWDGTTFIPGTANSDDICNWKQKR